MTKQVKHVELSIGGELAIGDVVGIAYTNGITFGWYTGIGSTGSLKYIGVKSPEYAKLRFESLMAEQDKNQAFLAKRYPKGLEYKHVNKDYVLSFNGHNNRAFKVSDPEQFFKGSQIETEYLSSKEILKQWKFPAK